MSPAARFEPFPEGPVPSAGSQQPAESSARRPVPGVLRDSWHVLPRDFMHRRRAVRLLADILLIAALSSLAAYAITRSSQGPGFTPPKSFQIKAGSPAAPDSAPPNRAQRAPQ